MSQAYLYARPGRDALAGVRTRRLMALAVDFVIVSVVGSMAGGITALLGAVLLRQPMARLQWAGVALILSGIAVLQGVFDSVDPKGNFNPGKIIAAPGLDQGNSGSALKAPARAARKSAVTKSAAGKSVAAKPAAAKPAIKRSTGSTAKSKVNAAK